MNLRPDELSAQADIEKSRRENKLLKKGAGLALGLGTAALGMGAVSKIMPFLNDFIPLDLAIKGISSVSPETGKFLRKGQSMGLNLKEGLDFIKEKIYPKEEKSKSANPLNDFEMNYPDIAKALSEYINKGQSPDAAAGILKTSSAYGKKISQLEKESGKNFIDYVLELFGGNQQTQSQQPSPMQQPQQNQIPQQMQQSQGNSDQALMAALDKILKM